MALPRRIFVTGSALRTGRAVSRHLASQGAQLVLHANRSFDEAGRLCRLLPGEGHIAVSGDFASDGDVEKLCSYVAACDGVVLNASCYRHGYSGGDPDFDRLLEKVNHTSQMRLLTAFVQAEHPDGGAVVAMLDQAVSGCEDNPYLSSRRALWKDMKSLAKEYGRSDLRFNAIAPGPILPPPELGETGMVKTLPTLPLRRSVALEDMAKSVEFLLSCRSITGALLFVDCGQSLANRTEKL